MHSYRDMGILPMNHGLEGRATDTRYDMRDTRYIVAFIAAAIIFAVPSAYAHSGQDSNQTQQGVHILFDNQAKDPNFVLERTNQLNTRRMFIKMMLAVLIVLALGVSAVYVSKKLGSRIVNSPGKEIRLLETLYLGSRKSIHLLKIGNRRIVIGCTADRITKLTEIPGEAD